jgi:hypothetical protein
MPSFNPLSTLSACRTSSGTRGFDTTASPSAASVGARIVPTTAASQTLSPPNITAARHQPKAMVRGSPSPRRRLGRATSERHDPLFTAIASVKSTRTSVASNVTV